MSALEAAIIGLEATARLMVPIALALLVAGALSAGLRRAIGTNEALESLGRLIVVGVVLALAGSEIAASLVALADWMWGAGLAEAVARPARG